MPSSVRSDQTTGVQSEAVALPCPFCGGHRISHRHVRDGRQMHCVDCGASAAPAFHGPNNDTAERATKEWNTRTSKMEWHKGAPPFPWSEEWFIAETTWGDRVVLTSLPKEWTHDFKTADETYIKADKIKRWMQFPDSDFIPFAYPAPALSKALGTEER